MYTRFLNYAMLINDNFIMNHFKTLLFILHQKIFRKVLFGFVFILYCRKLLFLYDFFTFLQSTDNTTHLSPPSNSILFVRLRTNLYRWEVLLFFEYINMILIVILISLNCFVLALRFVLLLQWMDNLSNLA